MASQFDPILEELFSGKTVVLPRGSIDMASFRTAFHRSNRQRKEMWGKFYKEQQLRTRVRKNAENNIPELVLFLVDKPDKPVYNFYTLD